MRVIKFKAYDVLKKEWLNSDDLIFQCGLWFKDFYHLEDYKALDLDSGMIKVYQFTGLYDKNGKEIYEGDLVCLEKEGFEIEGFVMYYDGSFFINDTEGEAWNIHNNSFIINNVIKKCEVLPSVYD